jgi:hypothetical protein
MEHETKCEACGHVHKTSNTDRRLPSHLELLSAAADPLPDDGKIKRSLLILLGLAIAVPVATACPLLVLFTVSPSDQAGMLVFGGFLLMMLLMPVIQLAIAARTVWLVNRAVRQSQRRDPSVAMSLATAILLFSFLSIAAVVFLVSQPLGMGLSMR